MTTQINDSVLTVIRDLFDACGAQSFAQIVTEVRQQAIYDNNSISNVHDMVIGHLDYLVKLGSVQVQNDEFGIVWGHPGDF